jgi:hypothetical protein
MEEPRSGVERNCSTSDISGHPSTKVQAEKAQRPTLQTHNTVGNVFTIIIILQQFMAFLKAVEREDKI